VLVLAITPILGQFGLLTAASISLAYVASLVVLPPALIVWAAVVERRPDLLWTGRLVGGLGSGSDGGTGTPDSVERTAEDARTDGGVVEGDAEGRFQWSPPLNEADRRGAGGDPDDRSQKR